MGKYRFDPAYWDESPLEEEGTHYQYKLVVGAGVQADDLYAFPKGKASTHDRLMGLYVVWARAESGDAVWMPGHGYQYNIWNSVALSGREDIMALPLSSRQGFSKIMAERISALAIILCPPAVLKSFSSWEKVLTTVMSQLTDTVYSRVSKLAKNRFDADWKYITNRHVPAMYRYNRVLERTGWLAHYEALKDDLALCLMQRHEFEREVMQYVETQAKMCLCGSHNWMSAIHLHMLIPGIWEGIAYLGLNPREFRRPGYFARSTDIEAVLRGGSTAIGEVTPSAEENEYFSSAWNEAGSFVFLPGEHSERAENVLRDVSHANWCTSNDQAGSYSTSPFLVALTDGQPEMAIRWDGEDVAEIQSPINNGVVTAGMRSICAERIIPNLDDAQAQSLCVYLDAQVESKEWVTDPTPVDVLVAAFNAVNQYTYISDDHIVYDVDKVGTRTMVKHFDHFFHIV